MKNLLCGLAFWAIGSAAALAGHDPVAEAVLLKTHACSLHGAIEARAASPYAIRTVHRLESSVEALVEKMSCPHDLGAIQWAMDDVLVHVDRVVSVVKASCELRADRQVVSALNCTLEQVAITDRSIQELIARSVPTVRHHGQSPWYGGQDIRGGAPFGAVGEIGHLHSSRYGQSGGLDRHAELRGRSEVGRTGARSSFDFSRSSPYATPPRSTSPFVTPGFGGPQPFASPFSTTPFPPAGARADPGFGAARSPVPPAFPAPPVPAAGNGAVGRALLGVILSELSR